MLRHLFLHIHKTGGTSVVENLWRPLIPLAERYLEDDFLPGEPLEGSPYLFQHMYTIARDYHLRYRDVFAAFWNTHMPRDRRLYSGHFGFGIHEIIGEPYRYSTVIRHPVERTLSHFHLLKSIEAFPGGFADYLAADGYEVSNYQVKMLTRDGFFRFHMTESKYLDEALHHLMTEFDFCTTESIDDFMDELIARYHWPIENRRIVANRTDDMRTVKGSPQFAHRRFPIDPELVKVLEQKNQLDMILYRTAREEYRRRRAASVIRQ